MALTFPYRTWGPYSLPMIPVGFADGSIVYALVDSGANVSIFEASIADKLGITVEEGKQMTFQGIGGRIVAYEHTVPIQVGSLEFNCKIAFSREYYVSLNLLGRDNFFLHFLVTFDEKKREILLEQMD